MTTTPVVVVEIVGGQFTFAAIENRDGSTEEFEDQPAFLEFLKTHLNGCFCLWQEWRNEALAIDRVIRVSA